MNKLLHYTIILVLLSMSASMGKVLIVVAADYSEHDWSSGNRVQRFINAVNAQGITTQLVDVWPGHDQYDVWYMIRDRYAATHGTADPVKGAILVGNIPPPVFYSTYIVHEYMACDYFYMDVWDTRYNVQYGTWDVPWDIWNGEYYTIDRSQYYGDRVLDLWVSRIYATNLNYLRSAGAPWGTFLEEYEIIDNYFDRVHERMTQPAKVPHRGFAMGPPPGGGFGTLQEYCALDRLGLNSVYEFDMSNLQLNQSAAWQAQLQSGPYGNINYGSFNGQPFSATEYRRDCRTSYPGTQGYEWAAIYAHSTPELHGLHMYSAQGAYAPGGKYTNCNNAPAWEKKTGGYSGTYYECTQPHDDYVQAEWSCVVPWWFPAGEYETYMYWSAKPEVNSENSVFSVFTGKNFYSIGCGPVNQKTSSSGWYKLTFTWPSTFTQFHVEPGDTLVFSFGPNYFGYNRSNNCIADAVRFRKASGYPYTITITTSPLFDINNRGSKGFRLTNWYNRSFYDMQDNGGMSKVPFFEIMGCRPSNFLYEDNIGLLYAMGHEGLTCLGNSVPTNTGADMTSYTTELGNGQDFGEAYRTHSQQYFPSVEENFNLFGAGVLSAQPYYPYVP